MTEDEFKIEKDVPMPRPVKFARKYPFDKMTVGDSFAIPLGMNAKGRLAAASCVYGRRTGKRFSIRQTENEIRCWCVEDKSHHPRDNGE